MDDHLRVYYTGVESQDRLDATWAILPWQTGEQAEPIVFCTASGDKS